jgi:hypothetical protein
MGNKIGTQQNNELKNNLYFAGTIYDSFEALEEVLGKLKLEKPLFLVYLAKKAYAEEVMKAAGENDYKDNLMSEMIPAAPIEINCSQYQHLQ